MPETLLLVGTRKGLWVARSDHARETWSWSKPKFLMDEIYSVCIDTRGQTPRLFAGATSPHWGPQVFRSDDLGETWEETLGGTIRFPEDTARALERVWQIQPGPVSEPNLVYAGAEPSALFRSTDRGEHFEMIRALWDHPHREQWQPGGGGQAIHTVLPDPVDAAHVTVAMSTGGVYQSDDSGGSWHPTNRGIGADFMPGETPDFGQCVHKVARDAGDRNRLYAQNHGGVYRSDDSGASWSSIADGLPADFGFPVVAHPRKPGTLYVFPLVADIERFPPGGKPGVWRSDDAGETWHESGSGLPDQAFTSVLRDAFSCDDAERAGLYIGTRHGDVWISNDEGEHWVEANTKLPDVLSVRAATL